MDLQIITGPLVGSAIGYFTNYIAVKMLFRPLKPVYIKGHKLPFTLGIIPSGRERLAKAVGSAVGGTLLTGDSIKEVLLSDDITDKLRSEADRIIKEQEENKSTIKEAVVKLVGNEQVDKTIEKLGSGITERIMDRANSLDIGNMIATQVAAAVKEKIDGMPLLSMVVNENMINSFVCPAAEKINYYIMVNGPEIVYENVVKEEESLLNKQIGEIVTSVNKSEIKAGDLAVDIYKKVINEKIEDVMSELNLAKIVEDKIMSMDVLELEELLLSVIKKELNAIVNLGAVIGFILGCINIFI